MKVLSDAAQQEDQSTSVEDVAGATPDNSSVAIISQSVNSSGSVSNGRLVTMMGVAHLRSHQTFVSTCFARTQT